MSRVLDLLFGQGVVMFDDEHDLGAVSGHLAHSSGGESFLGLVDMGVAQGSSAEVLFAHDDVVKDGDLLSFGVGFEDEGLDAATDGLEDSQAGSSVELGVCEVC